VFHPLIQLLNGDAPDSGPKGWKAGLDRVVGWLRTGVQKATPVLKRAGTATIAGGRKAGQWTTSTVGKIRGKGTEAAEAPSADPTEAAAGDDVPPEDDATQ